MSIRSLKCSIIVLAGLCISPASRAQFAVQAQFGAVDGHHNTDNANTDSTIDNFDSKQRLYFEYNLGCSYQLKSGIELLIGGGYAHSRSRYESRSQYPIFAGTKGSIERDNDYLNLHLSIGKAYRINSRFYWLAQAGVHYYSYYRQTKVQVVEQYDLAANFTGAKKQTIQYPNALSLGLVISPGLFCSLTPNLSLGLQFRSGYYWDRTKGPYMTTSDTYDANRQQLRTEYTTLQVKHNETHLRYAPFFTVKYELRRAG